MFFIVWESNKLSWKTSHHVAAIFFIRLVVRHSFVQQTCCIFKLWLDVTWPENSFELPNKINCHYFHEKQHIRDASWAVSQTLMWKMRYNTNVLFFTPIDTVVTFFHPLSDCGTLSCVEPSNWGVGVKIFQLQDLFNS